MTSVPPRAWLLVTACYCVFTLSDGALRMLVLLHLHDEGRTAWALALVLLPYEIAGVFTNLLGGWLGARFGLRTTLVAGLWLQVLACLLLAADAAVLTLGYVMATQVLSGIAKDFAKNAAKSYLGKLAPREDARAFRWVAALTGSKNAMKGLGFFAGGVLLALFGFRGTNLALALLLAATAVAARRVLPVVPPTPRAGWSAVLRQGRALRWLAAARAFLFGSRDVWFAVALPIYLASAAGFAPPLVGAVLSVWVVAYGAVQAATPRLVAPRDTRHTGRAIAVASAALVVPLLATAIAPEQLPLLLGGLAAYGVVFAVASSLHSGLEVQFAGSERTAERVGFYYAANSVGRVAGTLGSGALFQAAGSDAVGFSACLFAAAISAALAAACTLCVRDA